MLSSLRNVFRIPDLRNKILFTLMILAVYRLGSHVPVPGIDISALKTLEAQAEQGGVLAFFQLFSGGALTNFAVFALGIMPYITSSIIIQILTVVIPKLEQWQQQGAVGQRKLTQATRYLTIAIAIVQSTGLAFVFHNGGAGFGAVQNPTNLDLFGGDAELHASPRVGARRADPRRRHRAADVVRRAHHPARHRQRHVAADLRLGRVDASRARARRCGRRRATRSSPSCACSPWSCS